MSVPPPGGQLSLVLPVQVGDRFLRKADQDRALSD